jgi:hypothetical protein
MMISLQIGKMTQPIRLGLMVEWRLYRIAHLRPFAR